DVLVDPRDRGVIHFSETLAKSFVVRPGTDQKEGEGQIRRTGAPDAPRIEQHVDPLLREIDSSVPYDQECVLRHTEDITSLRSSLRKPEAVVNRIHDAGDLGRIQSVCLHDALRFGTGSDDHPGTLSKGAGPEIPFQPAAMEFAALRRHKDGNPNLSADTH